MHAKTYKWLEQSRFLQIRCFCIEQIRMQCLLQPQEAEKRNLTMNILSMRDLERIYNILSKGLFVNLPMSMLNMQNQMLQSSLHQRQKLMNLSVV